MEGQELTQELDALRLLVPNLLLDALDQLEVVAPILLGPVRAPCLPVNHQRRVDQRRQHVQHGAVQVRVVGQIDDAPHNQLDEDEGPLGDRLQVAGDRLEHAANQRESQLQRILHGLASCRVLVVVDPLLLREAEEI